MQLSLFEYWLFLLWITGIEGLEKLWKRDDSLVNHKTMKIILESCYKDENLANPIVIIGNCRESIGESPVIKLDKFYNFDEEIQYKSVPGSMDYAASKIILIEDSPKKLQSDLTLLQRTKWWNHMALFFIIEENTKTCENAMDMLITTSGMHILNSIYICTESNNTAALYTFNQIANYAPSPWIRKEKRDHLYMFHQMFDSNIACESLHYDKTENLHGSEITFIVPLSNYPHSDPTREYLHLSDESLEKSVLDIMIRSIFKSWNATARIDIADSSIAMMNRFEEGTADLTFEIDISDQVMKSSIPAYIWEKVIIVGKFRQEVSTLTEIRQLWSSTVLVGAAIVLTILLIMLTIQSRNFSTAVLDLIRLLTCTSILANNRSHKFRIYFTTILIFIVIIYGVFQGFIVTFLIKPERVSLSKTFRELNELGYTFYIDHSIDGTIRKLCWECDPEEYSLARMDFVQNEPRHVLLLWIYTQKSALDARNLISMEEPMLSYNYFFVFRETWPLRNAFTEKVLRIFESGLLNFWGTRETEQKLHKYQLREDELSSTQYHPLKLNELSFAFKVLGIGLSISTIVFFIELIVAKDWKEMFELYFL